MLKLSILNILLLCHSVGRMMTKELLKSECEMQAGGRIGDVEFNTALSELVTGNFVDSVENKLTNDMKYYITDLGRAQL